jgi:endonuclease IV
MPHRVRSLLRYLNYGDLKKRKIIPATPMFTPKDVPKVKPSKSSRKMIQRLGYCEYGLFVESILKLCLKLGVEKPKEILERLIGSQVSSENLSEEQKSVLEFLESLNPFISILHSHFHDSLHNPLVEHLKLEEEWENGPIQGHPDLVSHDTVYDIKTTDYFSRMRTETIFQLLSYYCLAQILFPDGRIKNIGLILPTQSCILTVSLEGWDWKGFWVELVKCVPKKLERESRYSGAIGELLHYQLNSQTHVGTHIHKENLWEGIRRFEGRALQFFVGGCSNSNVTVSNPFRQRLKKEITSDSSVFIHAPYTLNLANPRGDYSRDSDPDPESGSIPWTCERLGYLLKLGKECGLKGVVVHFGQIRSKEKKISSGGEGEARTIPAISRAQGVVNMMEAVVYAAEQASKRCPLLLETPAGEKGELCSARNELIGFFSALPERVKSRVGLCVDTCHVFSAGYLPDEYIQGLDRAGIPIRLFHYNDSYYDKDCRRDCHAPVGEGYVGLSSMQAVLAYAMQNQIPCVSE